MRNFNLFGFVISILFMGAMGCQQAHTLHDPTPMQTNALKKSSAPVYKLDPLTQIQPNDALVIELAYMGYNESPATDSKVTLMASLSSSPTTNLGKNQLPPQKNIFSNGYPQNVETFSGAVTGVKKAVFPMRFPWIDIQAALTQINSDTNKPIYFNWTFTPSNGKTSGLYSINLSERLRNALTKSGSDVHASITAANNIISAQQTIAKATTQVMHALLLDEDVAEQYPLVNIDYGVNSFNYIGISVRIDSGTK